MFFTFNNDTKTCFENRNGIIQTRNVIISPRKPRKYLERTFTWNSSVAQLSLACIQNFFDPKFFFPKNFFEPKNILEPKIYVLTKKNLTWKFFWPKIFLPKFFFTQIFFRPILFDPKFFNTLVFFGSKIFRTANIFLQKNFNIRAFDL